MLDGYLLDTHALVWSLTGDGRLSPAARAAIANRANSVFVSSISLYELGIKHHLGKWPGAGTIVENASQLLARMQYAVLPLSGEHALHAAALPLSHRDPFDRLLVAQAATEGLMLISRDAVLANLGVRLLW
jgi:PIN domain nuclease of toxin-antitoxin system